MSLGMRLTVAAKANSGHSGVITRVQTWQSCGWSIAVTSYPTNCYMLSNPCVMNSTTLIAQEQAGGPTLQYT